jgi:hypothetical protein
MGSYIKSPTEIILERLPQTSVSGFTNIDILKLMKIIDSYHDFNGSQQRIRDIYDDDLGTHINALETAKNLEATTKQELLPSERNIKTNPFFFILNNYFNKIFPTLNADTFFSSNGVQRSHSEHTGELFFEKECRSVLYAGNIGCILTSTLDPETLDSSYAIKFEYENAIPQNNKKAATNLLKWFFPEKRGTGGIGFNFDAASGSIIKKLMSPLNDKTRGFYTSQIITPQNILDSAITNYYTFGENKQFLLFNDDTGRTEYVIPTLLEFSNLFTEDYGKFSLHNSANAKNPFGFDWVFTPNKSAPIIFDKDNDRRDTGPSVAFLGSLIYCWLKSEYGSKTPLEECRDKQEPELLNSKMISPLPIIKNILKAKQEKMIPRLLFDIKRMGDYEQVNSVYYYNNGTTNEYTTIFVTIDRLCALYSRLLGNPTILVTGKHLWCYRGSDILKDPLLKARFDVENTLSQLNYYLFNITSILNTNDFDLLLGNLEMYKDSTPFVGEQSFLKNILLRAKVYNTIDFLNTLSNIDTTVTTILEEEKIRLMKILLPEKAEIAYKAEGLNILLNPKLTISQLIQINTILIGSITVLESQMNILSVYLQNYNKSKFQTLNGDYTIFSNHHQLYFSESKLNSTLDEINYNKDDIINISAKVISISKGINLEVGKEQLQQCCYEFINGFFMTNTFNKTTLIVLLQLIIDNITQENVVDVITTFFRLIVNPGFFSSKEALKAAFDKDLAVVISRNNSVNAEEAEEAVKATRNSDEKSAAEAEKLFATVMASIKPKGFKKQQEPIKPSLNKRGELIRETLYRKANLLNEKSDLVASIGLHKKSGGSRNNNTETEPKLDIMVPVLKGIIDIVKQITELRIDALFLLPGNTIIHSQVYPHPMPFKIKIGVTNQLTNMRLRKDAMVFNHTQVGFGRRRKNNKTRRMRKIGGGYDIKTFTYYNTNSQAQMFRDSLQELKQYAHTLDKASEKYTVEIKDKWRELTSLIDAEGTPELYSPEKENMFTYDIRMLRHYVELTRNIDKFIGESTYTYKENLTEAQVKELLDPVETLRIGTNNITAYEDLIKHNEYELEVYNTNPRYKKNKLLCIYIISVLNLNIEQTKMLIEITQRSA